MSDNLPKKLLHLNLDKLPADLREKQEVKDWLKSVEDKANNDPEVRKVFKWREEHELAMGAFGSHISNADDPCPICVESGSNIKELPKSQFRSQSCMDTVEDIIQKYGELEK